ncbi:hypothetical protein MTR67_026265 [Solanum verrucosum]|uniref:Putative plant transposon protein domain-containing protein n=1 Tax=Solanum verrucosum TaxID=315347 RepID=A0AAF0R560_SOLVR|nr:hypothetical protein MTR67_026265 [Solanum verrucosum]
MEKHQERDQNMAKITTHLDILSKNFMGAGARSVNVVGVGCANLDECKFEPCIMKSCIQGLSNQTSTSGGKGKGKGKAPASPEACSDSDDIYTTHLPTSESEGCSSSTSCTRSSSQSMNKLKTEGLRTIIEEKRLSTDQVIDSVYSALIPQGKKSTAKFKPVDYVVVRGRKVKCDSDAINTVVGLSTCIDDDCQHMIRTKMLDNMKKWLAPLISDGTPRWLEAGAPIEKKDLTIAARHTRVPIDAKKDVEMILTSSTDIRRIEDEYLKDEVEKNGEPSPEGENQVAIETCSGIQVLELRTEFLKTIFSLALKISISEKLEVGVEDSSS